MLVTDLGFNAQAQGLFSRSRVRGHLELLRPGEFALVLQDLADALFLDGFRFRFRHRQKRFQARGFIKDNFGYRMVRIRLCYGIGMVAGLQLAGDGELDRFAAPRLRRGDRNLKLDEFVNGRGIGLRELRVGRRQDRGGRSQGQQQGQSRQER